MRHQAISNQEEKFCHNFLTNMSVGKHPLIPELAHRFTEQACCSETLSLAMFLHAISSF